MPVQLEFQKRPTTIGAPTTGTGLPSRSLTRFAAVALILVSSAVGVWLVLEGIGAARIDLALAKWVHFLALLVLIGVSARGTLDARSSRVGYAGDERGIKSSIPSPRLEPGRFATVLECAVVTLLLSGTYLLVGYSLHFGARFGPSYNALIGFNGLLLIVLLGVVYMSTIELRNKGQGFYRLIIILSIIALLLPAVLDVVPYV
ncbi:MAG: hypothetical protein HYY30_02810 [Chloroflexi bacterium]|nr:hypothetical protein [Chloroflexota bacterium]